MKNVNFVFDSRDEAFSACEVLTEDGAEFVFKYIKGKPTISITNGLNYRTKMWLETIGNEYNGVATQ